MIALGPIVTALVLLIAAPLLAPPAGADPVKIETQRDGKIERMRFYWPAAIAMNAMAEQGRLRLAFDRPLEADLKPLRALKRVAGSPTLSEDKLTLTVPLARGVTAMSYVDDRLAFVDLLTGAPERAPGSVAATKVPAPRLDVRTGEHGAFTRIVFDWPDAISYHIDRRGPIAVVTFDRPAQLDTAQLSRRRLRHVSGARAISGDDGLAVELTVADAATLRDFRLGPKVVIDVLGPGSTDNSVVAAHRLTPAPTSHPAQAAPAPGPALAQPPTRTGDEARAVPENSHPPVPRSAAPEAGTESATKPETSDDAKEGVAVQKSSPAVPSSTTSAQEPPSSTSLAATPATSPLRFDWSQPVAAAAFRRGDVVWCVFDRSTRPNLAALAAAGGATVRAIEQVAHNDATILRFGVSDGLEPRLARDGHAWLLSFTPGRAAPAQTIVPLPEADSIDGPRLVLPVPEPAPPIAVTDPEIGDTLVIVPVVPLSLGVHREFRYPTLHLPASAQGIVVLPLIDTLTVRSERDGVVLTSPTGLGVSQVPALLRAGAKMAPPDDVKSLLADPCWSNLAPIAYAPKRQELLRAVAEATGADWRRARIALARFYVAHRLGAEALGEVNVLSQVGGDPADEPTLALMRAAANLMLDRTDAAREALTHPGLATEDEAKMWRAAVDTSAGGATKGPLPFDRFSALLLDYPPTLRRLIVPLLAEAGLGTGQTDSVGWLIQLSRGDATGVEESAWLDYLEGRLLIAGGDLSGARALLTKADLSPTRRAHAHASLTLVDLDLTAGTKPPAEVIELLKELPYAWRGDAFEARVLRQLSEMYANTGDFASAMRTLRRVASEFGGRAEGDAAATRLSQLFEELFLGSRSNTLSPLAAVALFNEFRELTPPGEKGRLVALNLADRLLTLDLTEPAADLLETALAHAPTDLGRNRLGTLLARAQTRSDQHAAVLDALDRSEVVGMPDDVVQERRMLRANALASLGRVDEALVLLDGMNGIAASRLRDSVARRRGDWSSAGAARAEVLAATPVSPDAKRERSRRALDLAVARVLAGDEAAADESAPVSDPATETAEARALNLLVNRGIGTAPDRATLQRLVDEATQLRQTVKALTNPKWVKQTGPLIDEAAVFSPLHGSLHCQRFNRLRLG